MTFNKPAILIIIVFIVVTLTLLGGILNYGILNQAEVTLPNETFPKVYTNSRHKFSFGYNEGFTVQEINPEENAEIIIVEKSAAEGSPTSEGFQIFIQPFDEPFNMTQGKPGPITPERIKLDLPQTPVENPQEIRIGTAHQELEIKGLSFFSQDQDKDIGRTREIWFMHEGYLYQVTSRAEFDEELLKIMTIFTFN